MTDDSRSERRDGSGARNRKGFRSGEQGHGRRGGFRSGYDNSGRGNSGQGRRSWRNRDDERGDRRDKRQQQYRDAGGRGDADRREQPGGETSSRGRDGHRRDKQHGRRRDERRGRAGGNRYDRPRRERTEGQEPRPAEEPSAAKEAAPQLPENALPHRLDQEIRNELRTLPKSLADLVAKHLVAAGDLLDQDPERAYQHALHARRRAARVGAVREAAGVAAYMTGRWQEALSELRAARRITGQDSYLPMIADCERGIGRPERALEIAREAPLDRLDTADQVELRIVASGARRDMGDLQGALVELQCPQLKERRARPWAARLFYAYADVLAELGREEEAREYFSRASAVDRDGVTDADERLAALEGLEIVDVGDDVVWSDAEDPDFDDSGEPDGQETEPAAPKPRPEEQNDTP
ncbi:MAG TPA: tetratricopeptide repeat protein [Thermobifida alba]|nr:tetratricopeptide repeat protein [Thermobifida alba]